jgi:hypothetical protein
LAEYLTEIIYRFSGAIMRANTLEIIVAITVIAAIGVIPTKAEAWNPFKKGNYEDCVVEEMRGQHFRMIHEVTSACRARFPKLKSLKNPNYHGTIYCEVHDREFDIEITPSELNGFDIQRRTDSRIIAAHESTTIFIDLVDPDRKRTDLGPGALITLDLLTGDMVFRSTSDRSLTLN